MWSRNLAPDHSYLGSPDLLLSSVDVRDLLAEVEANALLVLWPYSVLRYRSRCSLCVVNTLNLDQASAGVRCSLRPLVAKVLAPFAQSVHMSKKGSMNKRVCMAAKYRAVCVAFDGS